MTPYKPTIELLGLNDVEASCSIVSALEAVIDAQKTSTIRSCDVICDGRYTGCFGVVVPRGQAGTLPFSYHRAKIGDRVYDEVVSYVKRLEDVFERYSSEDEIRYIEAAKRVSNYPTMQSSDRKPERSAKYFASLAVAKNATLASHIDRDFTKSIVTVLLKNYDLR